MPRRTIDVIDHESWIMGVLEPIFVFLVLGIIAVMIGLFSDLSHAHYGDFPRQQRARPDLGVR